MLAQVYAALAYYHANRADCGWRIANLNVYGRDEATGFLVPPGDAEGMVLCIERLLGDTIGFDE